MAGIICIVGGLIVGVINGHADYNANTSIHTTLTWILVVIGFIAAFIGFLFEIASIKRKIDF